MSRAIKILILLCIYIMAPLVISMIYWQGYITNQDLVNIRRAADQSKGRTIVGRLKYADLRHRGMLIRSPGGQIMLSCGDPSSKTDCVTESMMNKDVIVGVMRYKGPYYSQNIILYIITKEGKNLLTREKRMKYFSAIEHRKDVFSERFYVIAGFIGGLLLAGFIHILFKKSLSLRRAS